MAGEMLLKLIVQFPWALLLVRLILAVPALAAHELSHALTAAALGDPTPREKGRLTADPRRHLDPLGLALVVLLGIGWGRRVMVNPHRMRVPAWLGGTLAALAGPLASGALMLAGLTLMDALGLRPETPFLSLGGAGWLTVWVRLNLGLMLINLLPLFPFDGWSLIGAWLPVQAHARWQAFSGYTTLIVGIALATLMLMPVTLFRLMVWPLAVQVTNALTGW
ncbi:MAG: hypothetical protein Kow00124_23630 [Anaerolineae bacterium]